MLGVCLKKYFSYENEAEIRVLIGFVDIESEIEEMKHQRRVVSIKLRSVELRRIPRAAFKHRESTMTIHEVQNLLSSKSFDLFYTSYYV